MGISDILGTAGIMLSTAGNILERESSLSVEAAVDRLEAAIRWEGFNLIGKHDLAASMAKEGIQRPPYMVVEACHPFIAASVLDTAPSLGSMMPCAIAVFPRDGKTVLSTIRTPKLAELAGASEEVVKQAAMVDAAMERMMAWVAEPDLQTQELQWSEATEFYKVALFATGSADTLMASNSLAAFSRSWGRFKAPGSASESTKGTQLWSETNRMIDAARSHVGNGAFREAHETLEPIRLLWSQYRTANAKATRFDHMTSYHEAMEALIGAASESNVEQTRLTTLTANLMQSWAELKGDLEANWSEIRRTQWDRLIQMNQKAIDAWISAKTADAARALKPEFQKLFMAFG